MNDQAPVLSVAEWIERVVSSLQRPEMTPGGERVPGFPPDQLQANTTGLSGERAVRQAGAFYADVERTLREAGAPLHQGQRVLDFGCGWGRISRMFLRDTSASCIRGIDVDPEFIAVCRALFDSRNFEVCSPFPPADVASESIDLVVTYSVFSHLSEEAVHAWLLDFHRLLKPGGFVAFTTRHETFFDYVDWARTSENIDGYTRALGTLFADTNDARAQLRSGRVVHATSPGVSGGGVRNESFYGETWIPAAYIEREFGDRFRLLATCFDPAGYDQVGYVLQKI